MAVGKPLGNFSQQFNSVYNISLDLSGWDRTTFQVVAPFTGTIAVLATNDSGAVSGETQGNSELAINYKPVQVTNLETGTATNYVYGPGLFKYDVNAQFLKLQGIPASAGTSVYKLMVFNHKIG